MDCISPFYVRLAQHDNRSIAVGCGRCYFCLQRRRKSWFIRNLVEMRDPKNEMSVFVTLTYRDDSLPCLRGEQGDFSKRDINLFLHRFRKRLARDYDAQFRYFLVSEYGDQTKRPHYHALLYITKVLPILSFQKMLDDSWPWSDLDTNWQFMNEAMISYTCNYVLSYIYSAREGLQRPFMLSSRRPAIGYYFFNDKLKIKDASRGDFLGFQIFDKRYSLPRYYRDKILDEDMKYDLLVQYLDKIDHDALIDRYISDRDGDSFHHQILLDYINRFRYANLKLKLSKHKL